MMPTLGVAVRKPVPGAHPPASQLLADRLAAVAADVDAGANRVIEINTADLRLIVAKLRAPIVTAPQHAVEANERARAEKPRLRVKARSR